MTPEAKREYDRSYRQLNRVRIAERRRAYREAHRDLLIEQSRTDYRLNREKRLAQQRAYREANPEVGAQWRDQNREQRSEYRRVYRIANAEREAAGKRVWQEENRERRAELHRAWCKANPDRIRTIRANGKAARRAREKNAPVVEHVDRIVVYERDAGRCHLCCRKVSRKAFHVDHLVPLVHGGSHTYSNVAVAHPKCNLRRGPGLTPAQLLLELKAHFEGIE